MKRKLSVADYSRGIVEEGNLQFISPSALSDVMSKPLLPVVVSRIETTLCVSLQCVLMTNLGLFLWSAATQPTLTTILFKNTARWRKFPVSGKAVQRFFSSFQT